MKKENLLKTVKENGRTITLLENSQELPILGLTSEDWITGKIQVSYTIDLREVCKNLQDGEIFVIGRNKDCNLRPGYEYFVNKLGEQAESAYMNVCRTISRVHAFVERDGDNFKVYDCSLAGTIIILRKEEPTPMPKKPWWKRIFG